MKMGMFHDIRDELRLVLKGKTVDAILTPGVFVGVNAWCSLQAAVIVAVGLSIVLLLFRAFRKETVQYGVFGLLGVTFAALFAYLSGEVADYFLPGIIGSVALVFIALVSLFAKRPLAMLASHLTRGWPIGWYTRRDVYPAYNEVTIFWTLYFGIRAMFQVVFFITDNVTGLTLMTTVFGLPTTIGVLIASYIYGIARLRRLGGPGVEEYREGKTPPYKGQTRGF